MSCCEFHHPLSPLLTRQSLLRLGSGFALGRLRRRPDSVAVGKGLDAHTVVEGRGRIDVLG